ncbi:MAG TPA: ferrochelatase [Acidimicrobiales bacterium]|nr:ferrochelatase [Acidimicrobiales bacterium]
MRFDAILVVSFGGPEGPDDVMPFLQNVVRGRGVPDDRLAKVADQYNRFGGVSPINEENRRLITDLRAALTARDVELPVYWGNRNWYPLLDEAIAEMRDDGVESAAAFVTSAYSSYSSCRQYIENIDTSRAKVGPGAPEVVKLRPFFNHPGFVEPLADGLRDALKDHPDAAVLMSAHSIPKAMADASDYERQLLEVGSLVAELAGLADAGAGPAPQPWQLVYQSRSGPPRDAWLEPDINDAINALPVDKQTVIVVPIGFVSDHMEVVHDLDLVATESAGRRDTTLIRTPTPGGDPRFVEMILDLVAEAEFGPAADGEKTTIEPRAIGSLGPRVFPCQPGCCPQYR